MEGSFAKAPSFSDSSQRLLSYLSSTNMNALSSSTSSLQLLQQGPPLKRIKLEDPMDSSDESNPLAAALHGPLTRSARAAKMAAADSLRSGAITPPKPDDDLEKKNADETASVDSSKQGVVSPDRRPGLSAMETKFPPPPSSPPPLKATTMSHLQKKYSQELEYMLREFQKLERQLLGAKGPSEESAGSRERREKLHSFIQHLQDTMQQIESGCKLEMDGKSMFATEEGRKGLAEAAALTHLTREKEEEENVQKLEEHILANLLPVKVRLKKQLAAQQGAKHNPAGMPHNHHGSTVPSEKHEKGTFAEAADLWRKQAAAVQTLSSEHPIPQPVNQAPTQFGKPLAGGGSSLTQKLHGQTLGSETRKHGHGVGTGGEKPAERPKMYFAGMAGSTDQIKSSVSAASTVHQLLIKNPAILEMKLLESEAEANRSIQPDLTFEHPDHVSSHPVAESDSLDMTEEQKQKLRRKRRRKKRLRQEARVLEMKGQRKATFDNDHLEELAHATKIRKQMPAKGKKGGPRTVEYMCALCNECYTSTCDDNPWWALAQHECSKCCKMQIPRIDISSPANSIEYHPALLAHAEENSGGVGNGAANTGITNEAIQAASTQMKASPFSQISTTADNCDSLGSDMSDDYDDVDGGDDYFDHLSLSDDDSVTSSESAAAALASLPPADQAENERFGVKYEGPTLTDKQASRLLLLMAHASTCPCSHKSSKHRDVCRNAKWMMLHIRDCPGTTAAFDVCPFPWCRKVKHMLFHLVSCTKAKSCAICSPANIESSWSELRKLNEYRLRKQRERLTSLRKAREVARSPNTGGKGSVVGAATTACTWSEGESELAACTAKRSVLGLESEAESIGKETSRNDAVDSNTSGSHGQSSETSDAAVSLGNESGNARDNDTAQ